MAIFRILSKLFAKGFDSGAYEGMKAHAGDGDDNAAKFNAYKRKYAKDIEDYEASKKSSRSQYSGQSSSSSRRSNNTSSSGSYDPWDDFQKQWDDLNKKWAEEDKARENAKKSRWASEDTAWERKMKQKASKREAEAIKSKARSARNKKIVIAGTAATAAGIAGKAAYDIYQNHKLRQAAFSKKEKRRGDDEIIADAVGNAGIAAGIAGTGSLLHGAKIQNDVSSRAHEIVEEIAKDHGVTGYKIGDTATFRTKILEDNPRAHERVKAAAEEAKERLAKPMKRGEKFITRGAAIAGLGGLAYLGSKAYKDGSSKKKK